MRPLRWFRTASCALAVGLAVLAVVPGSTSAQEGTGTLVGQVLDAGRDAPVALARVSLPSLGRTTLADEEGRFRFEEVPAGSHELRVAFLGFEATVREVRIEAGVTERLKVWVTPDPISLEDLRVTTLALSWFPGFQKRRGEGRGHFFTAADVAAAEPGHLTDLLRGLEGVRLGYNRYAAGPERRYPQFYRRGPMYYGIGSTRGALVRRSSFCRPVMFVDGERIGPGHDYWYLNEIPPDRVLAMEVYYRPQDVPESIPFADLRSAPGDGSEPPAWLDTPGAGAERAVSGEPVEVRSVLAGAGLAEGFRRPISEEIEEAALERSVYAGAYDRLPELEHCGAIFVWTEFYPFQGD